jgi:monoamine oxidase
MRGADAILRNSYSALTEALADGLDIRLNCIVDSVDYAGARVRVATGCDCYEVAQVIVTVPLGVLQAGDIAFTPALPPGHQRAIHALGMGLINKLYLEFPRVFWDADVQVVGYQSARRGRWMSWYDYSAVTGVPILLGFCAGAGAAEVEALDDAASVDSAMDALRRIYGPDIPPPRAAVVTRWGQDPFARGAYSFLKVGARSSQRKTLATPIGGRLLLAGEHTDRRYPATTHGAWRAGVRAARRLLELRRTDR